MPRSYRPECAFDTAIEREQLTAAWIAATEMPHVTLDRALRLSILAGVEHDPKAERANRQFIVRFTREWRPATVQIRNLADGLHCVRHDAFLAPDAREALEDLAVRLSQRRGIDGWDPPQ